MFFYFDSGSGTRGEPYLYEPPLLWQIDLLVKPPTNVELRLNLPRRCSVHLFFYLLLVKFSRPRSSFLSLVFYYYNFFPAPFPLFFIFLSLFRFYITFHLTPSPVPSYQDLPADGSQVEVSLTAETNNTGEWEKGILEKPSERTIELYSRKLDFLLLLRRMDTRSKTRPWPLCFYFSVTQEPEFIYVLLFSF